MFLMLSADLMSLLQGLNSATIMSRVFYFLHLDHEEKDIICFFCSTPVNRSPKTGNNRIFVHSPSTDEMYQIQIKSLKT